METIRDLMNTECIVPDWLHDIFLGYDDPGAAHYSRSNIISRIIASPIMHLSPTLPTYLVIQIILFILQNAKSDSKFKFQ